MLELFEPGIGGTTLREYPQAEAAAAELRRAGREALALEKWIREHYLESEYEGNRHIQDTYPVDSVEQVRRQHVMFQRLLGEESHV